jgi:multicomponent Na+:H+ antiporter subunit B
VIEALINMVLLTLMVATTWGILRVRNLFAVVILGGIYSFLMATVLLVLDAVDVSMTEASVGAGISTVLMLATLQHVGSQEKPPLHAVLLPAVVALATGAILIYGTLDLPRFGDPIGPIHVHIAPRYLADSVRETMVPNVVTSVLASYRGYDTLGETTVIFTAGIGVLLLLRGTSRRTRKRDGAE